MVRMNLGFCHDKHELARVLQADPICNSYLPETYLSIEDFVNSGASEGLSTGGKRSDALKCRGKQYGFTALNHTACKHAAFTSC